MPKSFKQKIAEGKGRTAGCKFGPESSSYFCMDCDYEW